MSGELLVEELCCRGRDRRFGEAHQSVEVIGVEGTEVEHFASRSGLPKSLWLLDIPWRSA